MTPAAVSVTCEGCQLEFASRNALFQHLQDTGGACLEDEQAREYFRQAKKQKKERVLVLYGYILPQCQSGGDACCDEPSGSSHERQGVIRNGQEAAELLVQILWQVDHPDEPAPSSSPNYQRSYVHVNRQTRIVAQDDGIMGAVSELMATRLLPLVSNTSNSSGEDATRDWIRQVNQAIEERLPSSDLESSKLRVFGRFKLPPGHCSSFNAELDISHRHVEYLLPADFLYNPPTTTPESACSSSVPGALFGPNQSRSDFFESFASFTDTTRTAPASLPGHRSRKDGTQGDASRFPRQETVTYLHALKKMMQRLTAKVVQINAEDPDAVREKEQHTKARHRSRCKTALLDKQQKMVDANEGEITEEIGASSLENGEVNGGVAKESEAAESATGSSQTSNTKARQGKHTKQARGKRNKPSGSVVNSDTTASGKGKNMLQRKRYHNFTQVQQHGTVPVE